MISSFICTIILLQWKIGKYHNVIKFCVISYEILFNKNVNKIKNNKINKSGNYYKWILITELISIKISITIEIIMKIILKLVLSIDNKICNSLLNVFS